MPKKTNPTHTVELTEAHLRLIAEYVEVTHRAICGQYKPLIDLICDLNETKLNYKEKENLEFFLKNKLQPKLKWNESMPGTFDALGYQTYRDILEFFEDGKDQGGFFDSVYRHKMDQIAKEPKLKINKIK